MNEIIGTTIDSEMDSLILDLQRLIRQPSVSAKKQGITECASLVADIMDRAGIHSQILHLDHDICDGRHDDDSNVNPIVYGEAKSKANPNGKTILFYNHYDVQPEDPIELWDKDPFSGKVEGNYIFGRGASDDKGELITRIKAVEYFLKMTGDVPCNVKFIVEGEEEIGSKNISQYLTQYKDMFACDGIIWEFGYVDEKDIPIISLGMKGLLYIELVAQCTSRDAHSSLAVLIENPAWHLIRALNSMRDSAGRILVKDWYNEVRDFSAQDISLIEQEPFNEESFKKEYSIEKFVDNISGAETRKALAGNPTCNIAGILSGYIGEGAKTVLPAEAIAKLDFRLVPDMVPEKQLERIKKHLKENGFKENEIAVKFIHGEAAARVSATDPFVNIVQEAAKEIFGSVITSVSSAGTGPMHSFIEILKSPCVSVGSTYVYAKIHSPNEFARLDLLNNATKCICNIMEKFANS
ncbi:MAG TPA: M20/M25/M40 family metallo-hydrolase [Nitrososphaeraceae archaeon]|nr:M20/M25/M40 family metallo-hydrolase [Nitrososphaeraceae archaeon]